MSAPTSAPEGALGRLLHGVRRRERLADAAYGLTRWAMPAGLWMAAATLVLVARLGAPLSVLWIVVLPVPAVIAWAMLRPRSLRATARRVDRHYGLDDQLGSAWELEKHPPKTSEDPRSAAIIGLIIERAEATAAGLDPRPVVQVRLPGLRFADAAAVAAVGLAFVVPAPEVDDLSPWFLPELGAFAPTRDSEGTDLAMAAPLVQNLQGLTEGEDEVARIAKEMLEVLAKLENGDLDRAEAFAELERLEELLRQAEEKFEARIEEDPAILAEAMRELAEALEKHEMTAEAAEALERGDPKKAEEALDDAAAKAADEGDDADDALREAMQEAERRLSQAARKAEEKANETGKELDEAERRLRKEEKKQDENESPEERERRLQKQKRRLEELRRQHEREMAAQRRLEQLRREAEQAASQSGGQGGRKRSVQKLSRSTGGAARQAQDARRLQGLRDAMEDAKTIVRRSGKQDESAKRRRDQFRRFSKAAKGKRGKKKGDEGETTLLVEGDVGQGQPDGMIQMPGEDGQDGQGQGEPRPGGQDGDGSAQQGGAQGANAGMPGDGIGDGSEDPLGEEDGDSVGKRDVRVNANQGRGVSRAEVIRDSSQRGFATAPYREVYEDYRNFAQSALDNEAVPPAKRRTVKRYYQLIQPRQ